MKTQRSGLVILALAGLALEPAVAQSVDRGWFVAFERVMVAPVARTNTTQLVDAGTIDTDGFSELVFSMGGEFKQGVPESGIVGAILVPDREPFLYLLRTEGKIVFPLEVTADVTGLRDPIFVSTQQTARIAFPRYRVFLYNETASAASVGFFVYRSRCG
jgi:hypothetical protein